MLHRVFVIITFAAATLVAAPVIAQSPGANPMSTPNSTGRVPVGAVEIHYEIHGDGQPLVLLHGGVDPSATFGAPLAAMAKAHKVIAIHLRGHGFSSDSDEPWSAELMADDVAAVIRHLGIDKASVMGYSLGAAVSLQLAIRHPELVEKLVPVSVAFSDDGNFPVVRQLFEQMPGMAAEFGKQIAASPLGETYPDVDWERVMRKTGEMGQLDRDWGQAVASIKAPTLLVFADADITRPEHMVEFWKLLGGGQRDAGLDGSQRPASELAIIPNTTHYDLIQSPLLFEMATGFLGR